MSITLLGALALIIVLVYTQLASSTAPEPTAQPTTATQSSGLLHSLPAGEAPLARELGLDAGWQSDLQALTQIPTDMPGAGGKRKKKRKTATSVKIMLELVNPAGERFYLVDIKRGAARKDQRWEFPGGRLDEGESILNALSRELREEDPSTTLSELVAQALAGGESALVYKKLSLHDGSDAYLFKTGLSLAAWERLHAYWKAPHPEHRELYDFTLVPLPELDTSRASIRDKWTPKSHKLLKALRRMHP